jgi:hypothetical protein
MMQETPNSKLQTSKKLQNPNFKSGSLKFDAFLKFGVSKFEHWRSQSQSATVSRNGSFE